MVGVADRRGTNAEGLLGIFYVLDYGATGDGQHDDAGGIQAAITAAGATGGGLVAVPPGVYRLGRAVVWGSATNVTIWQHSGASFTGPGTLPAPAGGNAIRVEPSGVTIGGMPSTSVEGDAPAAGATGIAADVAHVHGREAFGGAAVVQAFADAAAAGAAATPARSDHRHGMPALPINHSINGLLNIWQRTLQAYTANNGPAGPDHLFLTLAGTDTLSATQDTAHADTANGAQFALACVFVLGTGAGASGVISGLGGHKLTTDNFRQWRSRQVTRSWRVRCNVANAIRLAVTTDGTGGTTTLGAFHPGDDTWQTLTVTTPVIPADATHVDFKVVGAASATFYVGAHATVIGAVAADPYAVALSPADDLARALRYYQRFAAPSNQTIGHGQAFSTTGAMITVPFVAEMGGVPTVTVSAAGDWAGTSPTRVNQACSAVAADSVSADHVCLNLTLSAAVLVAGNATAMRGQTTSAWLSLEWNS